MTPDDDFPLLVNRFLEDHPGMFTHVGYRHVTGVDEPTMVLDTEGTCAFLFWYVERLLCEKPEQVAPLIQACQEAEQTGELPFLLRPIIEELKSNLACIA